MSPDDEKTFVDCYEARSILKYNFSEGIYLIQESGTGQAKVFCDMKGWTVFQSRGPFGNKVDYFYRGWRDYRDGFGVPGA